MRSGEHTDQKRCACASTGQDVARRVTDDGDGGNVAHLGDQGSREHEIGMRTAATGAAGCEEGVGQIPPAERIDDAILGGGRESGRQNDSDTGLTKLRDRLGRTGYRRYAIVDARVVRRFEGAVRDLSTVLRSEQSPEHLDLGLPHRLDGVVSGIVAFGAGVGESGCGRSGFEGFEHQTVVADRGSGHVQDDEFDGGDGVRAGGVRHDEETAVWYRPLRGTRVNT